MRAVEVPQAAPEVSRSADGVTLIPVQRPTRHGPRPIGAHVIVDGHVRYQPAFDVERLVLGVVTVAGLAAVLGTLAHRGPTIGRVSMGNGGWVSVKAPTAALPRLPGHRDERRPWWARVLGAHRLEASR